MTTLMQRPRSTHSHGYGFNDHLRSHSRTASYNYEPSLSTEAVSPTSQPLGTSSELEDQLASLQRELLGQTSTLEMAGTSIVGRGEGSSSHSLYAAGLRGRSFEEADMVKREQEEEPHSHVGQMEDPAVMALVGQPSQLEASYGLDVAAAQGISSQLDDAPGHLSDLDLSSAATFQFPELPASLLDQAPEYEYVSVIILSRDRYFG
jgi:hypothetical protein